MVKLIFSIDALVGSPADFATTHGGYELLLDVLMFSRRAKLLVMLQAGNSFASFGVPAARAISIIT